MSFGVHTIGLEVGISKIVSRKAALCSVRSVMLLLSL